jgi:NAD(P)-dependent dehydrogenase (short-subunit alcohol dehydrogenase family)
MQTIAQLHDLKGKGAIVTGGGLGIGQAICLRLAETGASVMIADINLEAANKTAEQIVAAGGKAKAIHADVSRVADAQKVIEAILEAFGSLDILVNNAGIFRPVKLMDIDEAFWDNILDVNLKGAFFFSQTAAREMIKAGKGGRIINIASTAGLNPREESVPYAVSKAGVIMLTKAMAFHLGPHNILINTVAPSSVITPGALAFVAQLRAAGLDVKAIGSQSLARRPLGRSSDPDEIAKVVVFLASGSANYMTGSLLVVDGGFLVS